MKKLFELIAIMLMAQFIFAQEKQDTVFHKNGNPGAVEKKYHHGKEHDKRAMLKALNLSDDQKKQLNEMKLADKEKRAVILNDSKLTENQKKDQLKELHGQRAKSMQALLSEEQKTKLKTEREKLRFNKQNDLRKNERKNNNVDSTKK